MHDRSLSLSLIVESSNPSLTLTSLISPERLHELGTKSLFGFQTESVLQPQRAVKSALLAESYLYVVTGTACCT